MFDDRPDNDALGDAFHSIVRLSAQLAAEEPQSNVADQALARAMFIAAESDANADRDP